MSIDEPVPTTRIFVSGLPPSFTSKDLRAFIGQKFSVTDAHVFSDRRIAFVGLEDHDSAERAAKYFNRSFIRLSKISVELAKPVDLKRGKNGQAAPVSQRALREQSNTSEQTSRQQKRKRDKHDDGETFRSQQSSHQLDSIPSSETRELAPTSQPVSKEYSEFLGKAKLKLHTADGPADNESSEPAPATAPDADWLRGKTSRVLDLQEPEDKRLAGGHRPSFTSGVDGAKADDETGTDAPDRDQSIQTNGVDEHEVPNGRLFIRNLAFEATEDDLRALLSPLGSLENIHLVKDARSEKCKGLAFAEFREPSHAWNALQMLDGKPFKGRLLHILPASDKREQKMSDFELSKLPLKKQKEMKRKSAASATSFSWNSLYMNPDAVLASVANRLGVAKSELLDPSSADGAVKQARAETSIIQETKEYLRTQGIKIDAFKSGKRHDRALLLKNFPFGTSSEDLQAMLSTHGSLERLVFPPTGTMAIALFEEASSAQAAMKRLAYSNIKGSVLYLEKAPDDLFGVQPLETGAKGHQHDTSDMTDGTSGRTSTVFVRNLNFATTSARLMDVFKPLTGFLSARVKTRVDVARPGQILSMGFGFVEFFNKQQALAAVATMNGNNIDGHQILVQLSNNALDAAEERRVDDKLTKSDQEKTKVIIKNLPFEASKTDIKSLFGAYGKLRSVRMPKKFDNSTRGFAFAEFVTAKEAKNAVEALSSTHLLGRRLVLDFAESEIDDPEETIKAMEKKAGRQSHLTAVNKLITGSARRRFTTDAGGEETN